MSRRDEILTMVLALHAPVNTSHHLGRFSNMSDSYTSILCKHQAPGEPFMSEAAYAEHLRAELADSLADRDDEMVAEMAEAWGWHKSWITTGTKVASLVGDWLLRENGRVS